MSCKTIGSEFSAGIRGLPITVAIQIRIQIGKIAGSGLAEPSQTPARR